MNSVSPRLYAAPSGKAPATVTPPAKSAGFDPGTAGVMMAMAGLPAQTASALIRPLPAPPHITQSVLPPAAQGYAAAKSALSGPDG